MSSNPNWPGLSVSVDFTLPGSAYILLTTALTVAGGPVGTLNVSPLPVALPINTVLTSYAPGAGNTGAFQQWKLSAPAAQGANSVTVNSQTPNVDYPIGSPLTPWTDITKWCRRIGDGSLLNMSRGRNYERAQTDTGQMVFALDNSTGVFDPTNTSSPFYPNVKPIRKIWVTANWTTPAGTNVVPNGTFETSVLGWELQYAFPSPAPANPISQSSTQSHSGHFSMAVVWPTQVAAAQYARSQTIKGLPPGQTYTLSWANYNSNSRSVAVMQIIDPATSSLLVSSNGTVNSGTWNVQTATFTVPSSGQIYLDISMASTTAGDVTYLDDITITNNSPFSSSYNLFYGTVEEWPRIWKSSGFWGEISATARGITSSLSNVLLNPLWVSAAIKDGASAIYRLDDPSGSTAASNSSSIQQLTAPINYTSAITTASSFKFGDTSGNNQLAGDPTASLRLASNQAASPNYGDGYFLSVARNTDGSSGLFFSSQGPWSWEGWVNLEGVNPAWSSTIFSQAGTDGGYQVVIQAENSGLGGWVSLKITPDGASGSAIFIDSSGTGGSGGSSTIPRSVLDNSWHHVAAVVSTSAGTTTATLYVDGIEYFSTGAAFNFNFPVLRQDVGVLYASVVSPPWLNCMNGNMKDLAWYPGSALSPAQVTDHYAAGNGYSGDDTGTRIQRLLASGPYPLQSLDIGNSLLGPGNVEGKNLVEAIQNSNDTEVGTIIEKADGYLAFRNRQSRGGTASVATFGEAGSPYEDGINFQQDPKEIYTTIQVNRAFGSTINNTDTAAAQDFYPRTLSINSEDYSDQQAVYLSEYQLDRYKVARDRIPNLTLNPGANPLLWPQVLGREIGDRITVTRNNPGAPSITEDFYIDKISHDVQVGKWLTTYMLSSASLNDYWTLGDATFGVLGSSTKLGF